MFTSFIGLDIYVYIARLSISHRQLLTIAFMYPISERWWDLLHWCFHQGTYGGS